MSARKPPFGEYIRDYYGIAIEKGMHVVDKAGRRGVIKGASNYVEVQREMEKFTTNYHPHALTYPALGIQAREDG